MKHLNFSFVTTIIMVMLISLPLSGQRRSRPGTMKHSQTEIDNKMKETPVNATYIHNEAYFEGPIYYTDNTGTAGIKTGEAGLMFSKGKYIFSFESAKVKTRVAMTKKERNEKGISDAQYDRMWEYEKLSQDFDHSGRYKVIKQYDKIFLILYNGDTDNVFAQIPLSSSSAKEIELYEDNFLIKLVYVK